jgi:hypothetical protein
MALVGALMAIGSLFVKTESLRCPACGVASPVESTVMAGICPHCRTAIKRQGGEWVRV